MATELERSLPFRGAWLDLAAKSGDEVQVEVQDDTTGGGKKLYVHLNGQTVARIGKIQSLDVCEQDRRIEEMEKERARLGSFVTDLSVRAVNAEVLIEELYGLLARSNHTAIENNIDAIERIEAWKKAKDHPKSTSHGDAGYDQAHDSTR